MIEYYEEHQGEMLRLRISNEQKLNAMTVNMWHSLNKIFQQSRSNERLKCILIEGQGTKAFSAGADISEFRHVRNTREQISHYHENVVGAALTQILEANVPVIAKIQGICVGGGLEIAACCDFRIADESARLGAPVGLLGFPLAFGETQILFNLVGPSVVSELLFEGRIFNAEEAFRRSLLSRVVQKSELESEITETIGRIRKSALGAIRDTKQQIRRLLRDKSPVSSEERNKMYSFADRPEYQARIEDFLARSRI